MWIPKEAIIFMGAFAAGVFVGMLWIGIGILRNPQGIVDLLRKQGRID